MSVPFSRATKRIRFSSQKPWICSECHRSSTITRQYRQPSQQASKQDDKTTHFGFETVAESLKASKGQYCQEYNSIIH
jgi:2-methoxy-6-polyprenyl-1,4-benzoquinol methylase